MRTFVCLTFLILLSLTSFAQDQPKVTFYNGTFLFNGKLGSYKVKRKGKALDGAVSNICKDPNDGSILIVSATNAEEIGITELTLNVGE
ncbi:MAG: hypothetical protein H6603_11925, partial [Flavobacteriales bacterium]|nr:hypothetical protein [Flavobacteriales bacterium]